MSSERRPFSESRAFDLLAASPLVVWYGFAVVGIALEVWRPLSEWTPSQGWEVLLNPVTQLSAGLFLGLQFVLFLVRRLPIAKAEGIAPRIAGFVGANLAFAFLALPRAALSARVQTISSAIILLSTFACVVVALQLGRAFSVLPQARAFVRTGPYRFIRHPLYLAEQVGTWGLMLQFRQPWALLVAIASLGAQFPRMQYEEQILHKTFAKYADYANTTYRLIPGIY